MSRYLQFAVIRFKSKTAYRFDYFLGILNSLLSFVVYYSIYKALYGGAQSIDGVSFSMVTTSFLISLGLSSAFHKNEMFLQDKIKQGTIANELLKPINFKLRMLFEDAGDGAFNVVFNFLPTALIAALFANICAPSGAINILLCIASVILGYIVLWQISFIVQCWSFWLFSVWGIVTIKNVVINILAGAYIPMWFMPEKIRSILRFTPFESIYFMPVQLYLGQLSEWEILFGFLRQLVWIAGLYVIGELCWRSGIKRLVIQGG